MNNNKHLIETKIINNNFEITTMSALQLITFIGLKSFRKSFRFKNL